VRKVVDPVVVELYVAVVGSGLIVVDTVFVAVDV